MARLAVIALLTACSVADPERDCDPASLAAAAAGRSAQNCGHVPLGGDPRPAWACATKAFRNGVPFFVVEEIRGIDSTITAAVARAPNGSTTIFNRDNDPSGGSGAPPRTRRVPCATAAIETSPTDMVERVNCTGTATAADVCP